MKFLLEKFKKFKKILIKLFGLNKYIFRKIYKNNEWGDLESISGSGSTLDSTAFLIPQIEKLIKNLDVDLFLDLPCGDFNWFQKVDLGNASYLGGDIVPDLIKSNNSKYKSDTIKFIEFNLLRDKIPDADIIFVRDCLVHMSFLDAKKVIDNIKYSNIKYVVTTTFTEVEINLDIKTGGWRPINLELAPFNFPKAKFYLYEDCKEAEGKYNDKNMGVWSIESLRSI